MDVARGNQTLFMRHDEVMAAWDFIDPIISAAHSIAPEIYESGSYGPESQNLSLMIKHKTGTTPKAHNRV